MDRADPEGLSHKGNETIVTLGPNDLRPAKADQHAIHADNDQSATHRVGPKASMLQSAHVRNVQPVTGTHNANVAHARNADLGRISVPIQNVYLVTKATARHVLSAHHAGRETARNALEMIVGHAKNATAGHVQNAATTTVVIR